MTTFTIKRSQIETGEVVVEWNDGITARFNVQNLSDARMSFPAGVTVPEREATRRLTISRLSAETTLSGCGAK